MDINFGRFVENLKYMGIGLIGIFMIIGIIIVATYAIGYFTRYLGYKDGESK